MRSGVRDGTLVYECSGTRPMRESYDYGELQAIEAPTSTSALTTNGKVHSGTHYTALHVLICTSRLYMDNPAEAQTRQAVVLERAFVDHSALSDLHSVQMSGSPSMPVRRGCSMHSMLCTKHVHEAEGCRCWQQNLRHVINSLVYVAWPSIRHTTLYDKKHD